MRLLVINGSPKKSKTNTGVMIDAFTEHLSSFEDIVVKQIGAGHVEDIVNMIRVSDHIVMAMPLYGYSMPAQVLDLLNHVYALCLSDPDFKASVQKKSFGFIVQYGFKEAVHARPLEDYFKYYVGLIGSEYVGTIIKGGCDALYSQKDTRAGKNLLRGLESIAEDYNRTLIFDENRLLKYSAPESQAKRKSVFLMKIFVKLANEFYWKKKYEKYGVTEAESFAKPYE